MIKTMKKKFTKTISKVVAILLCILLPFVIWLIEPFYYIPFYQPLSPIQETTDFDCVDNNTYPAENLSIKAKSLLEQSMLNEDFLGVATGIYKKGCGSYISSAGFRSKRSRLAFTNDTVSRVASITKPMTAIAIMQLVERGLLGLDTPINQYLKPLKEAINPTITIRHLLTHTSGIRHYESKLDAISFTHYDSLLLAANEVLNKNSIAPAGEKFIYSSYGYTLLGAIIEIQTGMSYAQYMKLNIWDIAGMSDTSVEVLSTGDDKSRLYLKMGAYYLRSPYSDLSLITSAGGVQSTVSDLLKFGEAILTNKLVSAETLALMIDVSDSLAPAAGDDPYGLGWSVYLEQQNGRIISHSGSQPGASAYFKIYLDKEVVVATLSNAFGTKKSSWWLTENLAAIVMNNNE